MRKLWLRSTKRVISISVSDDIADFLSKQQNTSAFISDLVRKAMAAEVKPSLLEASKPEVELTEEDKRREQDLFNKCGGDPNEVIYKGLTRADILYPFEWTEEYTTQDVASKLGLSYDQAYRHIVPFLRARGHRIK